ncbi:Pre-rRNA-processing protein ipi3 [Coemansia brasiliensis]|uniref:Pre-rRNA-processing protein ipi3 n=1 Tax=Coemansia brasiliensis TaxID=2650707 RepID=A0A9W8LZ61_9FUNG|nr:Pre-rRNA-processing protein ipi3 [Coemansia brasiliensis]
MFTEIVSVGTNNGVQLYDLRRGTKLGQCVGVAVSARQSFGMCDTWLAAVNEKKAMCHVYILNRGDSSSKLAFPLPEEISCIQVLDGGKYLAAGAKSGRIMIWATGSGRMLGTWDAHYGAVTALDSSDSVLVSGGEDAAVHVWILSQVLDQLAHGDKAVSPIVSINEHTMPISAIHISQAGILAGHGRIYTAARDQTCKQWCIRTGHDGEQFVGRAELLATFLYSTAVNDIAVDAGETRIFVATSNGLYQTELYAYAKVTPDSIKSKPELVALGGTSDAVYSENHVQYATAEVDIAAVELSHDGTLLVTGAREGAVRVWDTSSRQCLRTISDKQLSGGVTQLSIRLAPLQLGGPRAQAQVGLQRPEAMTEAMVAPRISSISFAPLQRLMRNSVTVETTAFEAAVKMQLAGGREDMAAFDAQLCRAEPYSETGHADVRLLEALRPADGTAKQQQLQQQLEQLQRHSARTRALNDELYQSAVTEWLNARQGKA